MSQIKDEIIFAGSGLNTDDDKRFLPKGDSDYRLNVVPTDNGATYTVTNIKGTKKYSHTFSHNVTYSGSTYTVIGDCYDVSRNAVYYFIHSDGGNDCILRFNYDDQSFDKIVWDSLYLGFDLDYPLVDIFMIGDNLFYNPRTSSPRKVNIFWCRNYYDYPDPSYPTYDEGYKFRYEGRIFEVIEDGVAHGDMLTDITSKTFETVKWTGDVYITPHNDRFYNYPIQPFRQPIAEYSNDATKNYNNLKGRVFQFCYRYVYTDGSTSLSSPFSKVYGQPSGESYEGEDSGSIQDSNKLTISVFYSDGIYGYNFIFLIKHVDILFRASDETGWGDWKIAGNLDWVDVLSDSDFSFFNDKNYNIEDNVVVSSPYHSLPVLSKSQWSLDGKRVAYGGNTEGYDIPPINVTLSEVFVEQEYDKTDLGTYDSGYDVTEVEDGDYYYYDIEIPSPVPATGYILVYTENGEDIYLTINNSWSISEYRQKIANIVQSEFGNTDVYASGVRRWAGFDSLNIQVNVYQSGTDTYTRKYGFKSGASHKFCLFYYDNIMRRSSVVDGSGLSIYMPFVTEQTSPTAGSFLNQSVKFEVEHTPPAWASYWSIGYSGNTTISKFWQYTISAIANTGLPSEYDGMTEIDISSLQEHKTNDQTSTPFEYSFPNSNIDIYEFQEGDRIRFIASCNGSGTVSILSQYYDYEIKAFDETNNLIYIDYITTLPIGVYGIIEIYRPKRESTETVYYEISDIYDIYTSNGIKFHRGLGQDQTPSQAAEVLVSRGDIYYLTRLFSVPINSGSADLFPVESFSYSDFSDTEVWGKGKAGVLTNIGQTYNNSVRWSNQYLGDGAINGLSEFDGSDFITLTSNYGDIQSMRQVGGTLRVYFERNSASIYVNKTSLQQQDGVSQVVLSDQVLNQPNYSPYLYGTVFPESVRMVDRYVYFFDVYRGCFVRDSANGMIPISGKKGSNEFDYKMESWWKEKSLALRDSGISNVSVKTAWDEEHGLVVISIEDSSDADNNAVIAFHEGSNRWYSYLGINQESYTDQDDNVTEAYNIDSLSSSISDHYAEYSGTINSSKGAVYIPDISLSAGDKLVVIFEDDSADTTHVSIQIDDYEYLLDYNGEFLFDNDGNILIA